MTPICAVDTETTSLRPDRRAWDVALIRRDDEGERRVQFFIELNDIDLPDADPFSLDVGKFWERHPEAVKVRAGESLVRDDDDGVWSVWSGLGDRTLFDVPSGSVVGAVTAAHIVAAVTHGAHLIGAVPNFDAEVLAALLRDNGLTPTWHYHLVDVEALAVGWLCAWDGRSGIPPWRSDDISTALGVPPPAKDTRHTALGDAAWALAIYDHITGGEEKL